MAQGSGTQVPKGSLSQNPALCHIHPLGSFPKFLTVHGKQRQETLVFMLSLTERNVIFNSVLLHLSWP